MSIGRHILHYAKFIGLLALVLMIWLTSTRTPKPPQFASGQPKATGAVLRGKPEGMWTWWYGNGKKMTEGNFMEGKRSGVWKTWYEDGSRRSESLYTNDKLNGLYIQWYRNGKVNQTGNYLDDKRDGVHQFFDTTGVMLEERLYAVGVLIRKTNQKK